MTLRCPYCGMECYESNDCVYCPNCGVIEFKEIKNDNEEVGYIG